MPTEIPIDQEKLKALALDPRNGVKEICAGLGISDPTFYQHLERDPEIKAIYQAARDEMRATRDAARRGSKSRSTGAKGPRKPKSAIRSSKAEIRTAPPRNGNAKGGVDRELLRQLILEFNHLDVYGRVSEHFQEIREQMGALL
jgi:hypothetical protein